MILAVNPLDIFIWTVKFQSSPAARNLTCGGNGRWFVRAFVRCPFISSFIHGFCSDCLQSRHRLADQLDHSVSELKSCLSKCLD